MKHHLGFVLVLCTVICPGPARAQATDSSGASHVETPAQQDREARLASAYRLAGSGFELLRSGKLPAAAAAFRQAATVSSECPSAWLGLAQTYTRQGRLTEAVAAYREVIAHVPGYRQYQVTVPWPAELEFARILNRIGQGEEAEEVYRQALLYGMIGDGYAEEPIPLTVIFDGKSRDNEYSPERLECAANIALGILRMAHRSIGDPYDRANPQPSAETRAANDKAAIEHFRLAVKAQPDSGIAQFYLGYALYTLGGSKVEADRALDRALRSALEEIKAAVRELRATGKVTPPKVPGAFLRMQIRNEMRAKGIYP